MKRPGEISEIVGDGMPYFDDFFVFEKLNNKFVKLFAFH